jgi:superfamily II DNA or RNA helicase
MTSWTKRQLGIIDTWIGNDYKGLVSAYTAFGKSSGISIPAIKKVNPESLLITVPNNRLKLDWEKKLKESKLNGEVVVVNTLIKNKYDVELLIIDEIHRFAADTFVTTFDVVNYDKILGLTASPERQDGKEYLIFERLPLIEEVTIEEGLKQGWVDPFEVITIPIELTPDEKAKHKNINKTYEKIKKELGYGNPMKNAQYYVKYIDLKKWIVGKKTKKVYFRNYLEAQLEKSHPKLPSYKIQELINNHFNIPTKEHPHYKKALLAIKFYNIVAERKDLLYNASNKIDKTLELFEQYRNEYKFVFSQRIDFLEKLYDHLPHEEVKLYHSNMKKKDREESFKLFNDGRTKIKTLLSVKSLIEGVDIPKLSISIVTSFTSSKIDKIQTLGRTMRKYKDKKAIVIYLYIKGSQEEKWLKKIME